MWIWWKPLYSVIISNVFRFTIDISLRNNIQLQIISRRQITFKQYIDLSNECIIIDFTWMRDFYSLWSALYSSVGNLEFPWIRSGGMFRLTVRCHTAYSVQPRCPCLLWKYECQNSVFLPNTSQIFYLRLWSPILRNTILTPCDFMLSCGFDYFYEMIKYLSHMMHFSYI